MKIKERKITRTVIVNYVSVKCFNDETDEIEIKQGVIVGDYEEKEVAEIAREKIAEMWEGWTFIKIVKNDKVEQKCTMNEEDFFYRSEHTLIEK